ncbi:MAG: hypothetical protein HZB50_14620 [Chloroflexi bacterium]|nr:hypothetical protein [Chloroflexota bacterium]
MTNLKKSLFWIAFYLLFILILGQLDRADRPIINFAAFFYLMGIAIVPVMIFVPSLHKVSVGVPMFFWGAIYMTLLQVIDRSKTGSANVEVTVLEFVFLEVGVWLSYQLAVAVETSESLMDILAQATFPHGAIDLDASSEKIKNEFARSRRFHRPLSLIVVHAFPKDEETVREMLKSLQRDVLARLSNARIGQAIGEALRQTDLLLRDRVGRFIVLCPETDMEKIVILSERIARIVAERTGLHVDCGVASFPDEALIFEDLMDVARDRLQRSPNSVNFVSTREQIVK